MKELRPEAQEAYTILANYFKTHTNTENPTAAEVLEILEDHPIQYSDPSTEDNSSEWSVDVYKIGGHYIRAMVPYTKEEYGKQRVNTSANFDLNSLAIVYPVKVMITKYKTFEEIKRR